MTDGMSAIISSSMRSTAATKSWRSTMGHSLSMRPLSHSADSNSTWSSALSVTEEAGGGCTSGSRRLDARWAA